MGSIFGRKYAVFSWHLPVDGKVWVIPRYCTFALGGIVVVTLILEDGLVAEHSKAMSKTARNEELAVVVLREHHCNMLAKGRAALADVDRHIEHCSLDNTHELALSVGRFLIVKATHHTCHGTALIVLNKCGLADLLLKLSLRKALEEITAGIAKKFGFDDFHIGYFGINNVYHNLD